jgi:hypothetical protein
MKNLILILFLFVSIISFSQKMNTDSFGLIDTTDENFLITIDLNNPLNNPNKLVSYHENINGVDYFHTTFDSNEICGKIDTVRFTKKTIGYSNSNPYPKKDKLTNIIFDGKENILYIKEHPSNNFLKYKLSFDYAGGSSDYFCRIYDIDNQKSFVKIIYKIIDNTINLTELQVKLDNTPTMIYSN